jgi:hypothetical protein
MSFSFSGSFAGLVDHRPQVELALVVDVLVDVVAERHGILLDAAHRTCAAAGYRPRERQPRGELRVQLVALRDALQIVGQVEQQIDRKQLLAAFEDALSFLHQLGRAIRNRPFGGRRPAGSIRSCAEPPGNVPVRPAAASRRPARIEQIASFLNAANGAEPNSVSSSPLSGRNTALAAEDLPEPGQPLHGARSRPGGMRIVDLVDGFRGVEPRDMVLSLSVGASLKIEYWAP